jgi:hypothetical protein
MKSGYLYVLVHPSDPDLYKVGQTTRLPQERLVEPLPNDREPISIDMHIAEQAFRDLHYRLQSEIALAQKVKE